MPAKHTLFWLLLWSLPLAAQSTENCRALSRRGLLPEARRCFEKLASSADPYFQAEAFWGLGLYKEANQQFRRAVNAQPKNPEYRVRWGRLFLERFNKQDAANLFQEALALDKKHAGALLGLALAASDGFGSKAAELAEQALEADPKLAEARELLARLALEDNHPEQAIEQAAKALAIDPESLPAMAIHATIDWLNDRDGKPWMDRIFQVNPVYAEAYATAGYFFVLNRRYEEGIRFYRKAIELNPRLSEARA